MCGFVGFLGSSSFYEQVGDEAMLKRMADTIMYRGPDDAGYWFDGDNRIGLGHRRLSIVDLSPAGHQPMQSSSSRYVIAFNGEIYNHPSLRQALEINGQAPSWRGHSDTETLLAGFDVWGIQGTVERAIGMFAFAVWDRQTYTLTLGRDRFGEKPLYYGWQGRGNDAVFLFGSELKALRAHPAFESNINRGALSLYMRHNYIPAPYSIYEGVGKLSPGCLLTVSLQQREPKVWAYWSFAQVAESGAANVFVGSDDQAVDELEALLKDAVRQQMMADVPLGAFLSGGVDSSTVVALMQAQSSRPVKTFTIGFNEEGYNEAIHAKAVARHLGTEHTELYVTAERALSVISRLPTLYDEPFSDSSQIPTFLVSQLARQHVTVSLSGDAGDELFCGYNRYEPPTLLTGNRPALSGLDDVQRMMALDMMTYLPDDILTKVDRAAMGVSLETRVPFLDHRVVKFAWRVPQAMKLRDGVSKWILRQVLYRHVPKKLIERPKMGFGVPIDTWLRGPLKDWAEALLDEGRLRREGYFNPALVRAKWAEHLSGKRNWQYHLWDVLIFQTWLEEQ